MKILFLDRDSEYSKRFKYYMEKKYFDIIIDVFDNIDSAKSMLNDKVSRKYDVFLLDAVFDESDDEELLNLTESYAFAYVSSTLEVVQGKPTLYRFCSVTSLYEKICEVYEKKQNRIVKHDELDQDEEKDTYVITFLPANGGAGGSTMAAACAKALSNHEKVLYLNLEQCSSDKAFFSSENKKGISNIVSLLRSRYTEHALYQIINEAMSYDDYNENENLSFVKGFNTLFDSINLDPNGLDAIIKCLRDKFQYDYIIVDADFIVSQCTNKLIELSDKLVLVNSGSDIAELKVKQFNRYIELLVRDESFSAPECFTILNKHYGNRVDDSNLQTTVIGKFPRYRTNDGTRISTHDIIRQILSTPDVFFELKKHENTSEKT